MVNKHESGNQEQEPVDFKKVKEQITDFLNEEIRTIQDIRRANLLAESSLDDDNDAFIASNKTWVNQVLKAESKDDLVDILDHFRQWVAGREDHIDSEAFKRFPQGKQEWAKEMLGKAKTIVEAIENL